MKKTSVVLKNILEKISVPEENSKEIEEKLEDFLKILNKKVKAEIFIGGSYAKGTLIKKDKYDVDVFIRFPKGEKISEKLEKVLKSFCKFEKVHGSRDYFRVKAGKNFYFELVPVLKIRKPKEAENITDLSYSHVKWINKKIHSKKLLGDIKLAKAFCHAKKCYGAESYIKGFSGYSLELLVYHYKGFLNFLKAMTKVNEKLVIDVAKLHRNKRRILMDLNESKLDSPIVLIDPTFKQRNALACLSSETLDKFKKDCEKFLKNPSEKDFEIDKINLEKVMKEAKGKKLEFVLIEAATKKQEGDIAGTKLMKFYKHLEKEISPYFEIKKQGFNYNDKKTARYFFVLKSRGEFLVKGPSKKDKKNSQRFKKKHKKTFVKKRNLFAREKIKPGAKVFINSWKKKNKEKIKQMSISKFEILD